MERLRAQAYHMSRKHADAVNEYIDQLEVERKELIEIIGNIYYADGDSLAKQRENMERIAEEALKKYKFGK